MLACVGMSIRCAPMNHRTLLLTIIFVASCPPAFAQSSAPCPLPHSITIAKLESMFKNMRSNTKWNVDGELLWGYFFNDPDPKKLQPVADELTAAGYTFVDIHQAKDGPIYFLHVEKVETHTLQSLNLRNQEFYRLAERRCIASYDGMDVGPAPARRLQ
jgi:Regulator of ribonuclease activity B